MNISLLSVLLSLFIFIFFQGYGYCSQNTKEKESQKLSESWEDYEEEDKLFPAFNPEPGDWKWCLLSLDGNATILQIRQNDFINYLRINIASLIGSNYEKIHFNSVSYGSSILVNVSLDFKNNHRKILDSLGYLSKHNDTLFDLSGYHFNITDFRPSYALYTRKSDIASFARSPNSSSPKDIETLIYISFGALLTLLLTASLFFALCQSFSSNASSSSSSSRLPKTSQKTQKKTKVPFSINDSTDSTFVSPSETEILTITPSTFPYVFDSNSHSHHFSSWCKSTERNFEMNELFVQKQKSSSMAHFHNSSSSTPLLSSYFPSPPPSFADVKDSGARRRPTELEIAADVQTIFQNLGLPSPS